MDGPVRMLQRPAQSKVVVAAGGHPPTVVEAAAGRLDYGGWKGGKHIYGGVSFVPVHRRCCIPGRRWTTSRARPGTGVYQALRGRSDRGQLRGGNGGARLLLKSRVRTKVLRLVRPQKVGAARRQNSIF